MTKGPKISIIVPTLNEEEDIKDMLESLSKQSYKNLEIIIVDGGSTDKTIEISKKYKAKIFILPKAGVTVSRNFGAKKAKGQIFQFMDADALVADKDYFKKVVDAYKKYKVDIVVNKTGAYPPKNLMGRAQLAYRKKTWEARQKGVVFGAGPPNINFSCYSRKAFYKLGGYDEKMIGHDDVDLSRRAKKAGMKTVFMPDIEILHKDPYTFKQLRRQAKWYARVLIRHQTPLDQIWTNAYLGAYPTVYIILAITALTQSWRLFGLFNLFFILPTIYLSTISKDIVGSAYLIYVLNPTRGALLCPRYFYELLKKLASRSR